jgi:hypothetical protein
MGDIGEWAGLPPHVSHDQFEPFDLPPDKAAHYDGLDAGAAHAEKMKGMGVADRNRYMAGLREGLSGGSTPKRGDLDNPLARDMPKEPKALRAPRQQTPRQTTANAKRIKNLARISRGRRR